MMYTHRDPDDPFCKICWDKARGIAAHHVRSTMMRKGRCHIYEIEHPIDADVDRVDGAPLCGFTSRFSLEVASLEFSSPLKEMVEVYRQLLDL